MWLASYFYWQDPGLAHFLSVKVHILQLCGPFGLRRHDSTLPLECRIDLYWFSSAAVTS